MCLERNDKCYDITNLDYRQGCNSSCFRILMEESEMWIVGKERELVKKLTRALPPIQSMENANLSSLSVANYCTIHQNHPQRLWVTGGEFDNQTSRNTWFLAQDGRRVWVEGPQLLENRQGHFCGLLAIGRGRLHPFVFGGYNSNGARLDSLEAFEDGEWKRLGSFPIKPVTQSLRIVTLKDSDSVWAMDLHHNNDLQIFLMDHGSWAPLIQLVESPWPFISLKLLSSPLWTAIRLGNSCPQTFVLGHKAFSNSSIAAMRIREKDSSACSIHCACRQDCTSYFHLNNTCFLTTQKETDSTVSLQSNVSVYLKKH